MVHGILAVQNADGPCPLLALVNALVLSTPADYAKILVETLRAREQVSLGEKPKSDEVNQRRTEDGGKLGWLTPEKMITMYRVSLVRRECKFWKMGNAIDRSGRWDLLSLYHEGTYHEASW